MNVVLIDQMDALRLGEASVGEHADLVRYVLPTAWSLQLLQTSSQLSPHCDHSLSYAFQLSLPLLELGVVV